MIIGAFDVMTQLKIKGPHKFIMNMVFSKYTHYSA
jgi:hypothetical protein